MKNEEGTKGAEFEMMSTVYCRGGHWLKVHKREKFYSSDFEFFTILYLVKHKY